MFGIRLSHLPFLVLLILAIAFFSPFFLKGNAFVAADTLYSYYPWKYYAEPGFRPHNPLITDPVNDFYPNNYNRGLKEGVVRHWNPYVLGGTPANYSISVGPPGRYYPPKIILHRLLPTHAALTLMLFVHVVLMGCFMYLYLVQIGVGWRGSLFGAVAYMFNGYVMVWLEFEIWVTAGAYLPLLLLVMERYLGARRFMYAFAGAAVMGLLALTGSLQLFVYICLMMMFYMVFVLIRVRGRPRPGRDAAEVLACLAVTWVGGVLVGAVEFVPLTELILNSSRAETAYDFSGFFDAMGRVPFRYFITMLFPDFFGSPLMYFNVIPKLQQQQYMNYNELCLYVGIAPLFAFAACSLVAGNAYCRFFLLITLLTAAMMTGTYVYYPFFRLVPGMDITTPTRLIFLFVFALSAASALGFDALGNLAPARRRIFAGTALLLFGTIFVLAFFGDGRGIGVWFNREKFEPMTWALAPVLDRLMRMRDISSPVMRGPLVMGLICLVLFLSYTFVRRRVLSLIILALVLALLSYDLMSFGRRYNTTVDPGRIYPRTDAIDFLLEREGPFRVALDRPRGLYVNTLAPFGLEEVGGYVSFIPNRTNRLLSYIKYGDMGLTGRHFNRWVTFGDFSSPLFDLLNVKYVLTSPNYVLSGTGFRQVYRKDLAVYENTGAMPRAFVVHRPVVIRDLTELLRYMGSGDYDMNNEVILEEDPSAEFLQGVRSSARPSRVVIDHYGGDGIRMTVDMGSNGWLVLSDMYYPGWKAFVDGEETPILRANCAFRAVGLGPGRHSVVWEYSPRGVRLGWSLTITALAIVLAGIVLTGRRYARL
jgi:hypothetical protein